MPVSLVLLCVVLLDLLLLFSLARSQRLLPARALLRRLCERLFGRSASLRGFRLKATAPTARRCKPKPRWVRNEVLRLAALSGAGCRTIEKLFNRLYARRRATTVGKSYVHYTTRDHRYEIEVLKRKLKHRVPRPLARNAIWALDLTGKGDIGRDPHPILGIEDHGSRKLLVLEALTRKNAWTLLGYLFLAVGRFGKPRALRTDNESMLRSFVFRLGLQLAGVRQQLTHPGCPWQNGRIERLFGTLKAKLDRLEIQGREALDVLLGEFRFWYNAARPHQHLPGLTPEEAWRGVDPYARAPRAV
ncbi:MAG: integrase core domain-containing protein [Burkholderiales bacterium]